MTGFLAWLIHRFGPDPDQTVAGKVLPTRIAMRFRRRATWRQSLAVGAGGTVLA